MTKYIWDRDEFRWLEVDKWAAKQPPRVKVPMLISDEHKPFRSMADGLWYDSKSAYRSSLRAKGYEELGNDMPDKVTADRRSSVRDDIEKTISERGYNI